MWHCYFYTCKQISWYGCKSIISHILYFTIVYSQFHLYSGLHISNGDDCKWEPCWNHQWYPFRWPWIGDRQKGSRTSHQWSRSICWLWWPEWYVPRVLNLVYSRMGSSLLDAAKKWQLWGNNEYGSYGNWPRCIYGVDGGYVENTPLKWQQVLVSELCGQHKPWLEARCGDLASMPWC